MAPSNAIGLLITVLAVTMVAGCGGSSGGTTAAAVEGQNPGECTDRADNDADGQFDCDDSDCAGSPDCQDASNATSNGTTPSSNDTSNGTSSSSNSNTSNGTSSTSNGTTNTSNGTSSTSNGTTNTSNGRKYPWGNLEPSCFHAVISQGCRLSRTWEVGSRHRSRGKSPYGAYDMAGNVWEWTADWYDSYQAGATKNPTGPSSGSDRVCRGG